MPWVQPLHILCRHWSAWAFIVSTGVLWGLPKLPFYHEDLPYIYDLGGLALVAFYVSLGCLSVSLGTLIFDYFGMRRDKKQSHFLKPLSGWFGVLALGWIVIYFFLMDLSAQLQ